jgi:hypothetical protein
VHVSYFACLFGLNNWINLRIEKEELNGLAQRYSAARQRKKPARPTRPNADCARAQLGAKSTSRSQSLSPPDRNCHRRPRYRATCPTPAHGLVTHPYPLSCQVEAKLDFSTPFASPSHTARPRSAPLCFSACQSPPTRATVEIAQATVPMRHDSPSIGALTPSQATAKDVP